MRKKINKTQEVKNILFKKGKITQRDAWYKKVGGAPLEASRLSAIIFRLRHVYGWEISTNTKKTRTGIPYAEYVMEDSWWKKL